MRAGFLAGVPPWEAALDRAEVESSPLTRCLRMRRLGIVPRVIASSPKKNRYAGNRSTSHLASQFRIRTAES